jgi:hypothetical protein
MDAETKLAVMGVMLMMAEQRGLVIIIRRTDGRLLVRYPKFDKTRRSQDDLVDTPSQAYELLCGWAERNGKAVSPEIVYLSRVAWHELRAS